MTLKEQYMAEWEREYGGTMTHGDFLKFKNEYIEWLEEMVQAAEIELNRLKKK